MTSTVSYLLTARGVTLNIAGRPYAVDKTSSVYAKVIDAIKQKADGAAVLKLLTVAATVVGVPQKVTIQGNQVFYGNQRVDGFVEKRLLDMQREGFDVTPLVAFVQNLMQNPSRTAVKELYQFMEAGEMPITPDGHFIAYKAVRHDYKDIHSGTIDNSVGRVVEMPRKEVDDNRDNHCSSGLHFCSFSYLSQFAQNDGHVMLVKINPKDVVSIPSDYSYAKGRCSRYEVIDECEDYLSSRNDVLSQSKVYGAPANAIDTSGSLSAPAQEEARYEIWLNGEEEGESNDLTQAKSTAVQLFQQLDDEGNEIKVIDRVTGKVLMSLSN